MSLITYSEVEVETIETADVTVIQEVKGPKGDAGGEGAPGENGEEVEIRVAEGFIQWKLEGDAVWINLIAVADLKGDKGDSGIDGQDGDAGQDATFNKLTVAIAVQDWTGTTAIKTVAGVLPTSLLWIAPSPADYDKFTNAEIRATAQSTDQVTFECAVVPSEAITVNVVIGVESV